MLYPVKVQFNEEVRSSLSLSPYAKVEWETERLERRVAEARLLASEGKLTEEAEIKVAEAVKTHTDAAQREIAQLRESDSDEAAIAEIAFASALAVQTEMLESHIEKDLESQQEGETGRSVVALVQAVERARETVEQSQATVRPSYEKLLGRVETESVKIYELFDSVKKDASAEEMSNVERRLQDIERKIAQATALKNSAVSVAQSEEIEATTTPEETVEATTSAPVEVTEEVPAEDTEVTHDDTRKTDDEAIAILRSALADIQKLRNYMTHIEVRRNVSIEDLVPLTMTAEEKVSSVITLLDTTIALQTAIGTHELSEALAEKVALGQQELELKISTVVALISEGKHEEAYEVLTVAHAIALDLDALTKNEPLKDAPVLETTATSSVESI
jgi:hypothetical protein